MVDVPPDVRMWARLAARSRFKTTLRLRLWGRFVVAYIGYLLFMAGTATQTVGQRMGIIYMTPSSGSKIRRAQ